MGHPDGCGCDDCEWPGGDEAAAMTDSELALFEQIEKSLAGTATALDEMHGLLTKLIDGEGPHLGFLNTFERVADAAEAQKDLIAVIGMALERLNEAPRAYTAQATNLTVAVAALATAVDSGICPRLEAIAGRLSAIEMHIDELVNPKPDAPFVDHGIDDGPP